MIQRKMQPLIPVLPGGPGDPSPRRGIVLHVNRRASAPAAEVGIKGAIAGICELRVLEERAVSQNPQPLAVNHPVGGGKERAADLGGRRIPAAAVLAAKITPGGDGIGAYERVTQRKQGRG